MRIKILIYEQIFQLESVSKFKYKYSDNCNTTGTSTFHSVLSIIQKYVIVKVYHQNLILKELFIEIYNLNFFKQYIPVFFFFFFEDASFVSVKDQALELQLSNLIYCLKLHVHWQLKSDS